MREGAATAGAGGNHDLDAMAPEQSDRRLVDLRRDDRLDAAREERDRSTGDRAASARGASASIPRSRAGSSGASGLPSQAAVRARRNRLGLGRTAAIMLRSQRSARGRRKVCSICRRA
jgi:hypothetical protein